jgi:hypothetical protein
MRHPGSVCLCDRLFAIGVDFGFFRFRNFFVNRAGASLDHSALFSGIGVNIALRRCGGWLSESRALERLRPFAPDRGRAQTDVHCRAPKGPLRDGPRRASTFPITPYTVPEHLSDLASLTGQSFIASGKWKRSRFNAEQRLRSKRAGEQSSNHPAHVSKQTFGDRYECPFPGGR